MAKTKPIANEPTDYEIRVISMKLATQHSRNCHYGTLLKLADHIYKFLKGKAGIPNND